MKLRLADVIGELRGRSNRRFVNLLVEHVEATLDAARLVECAARGEIDWAEAAVRMQVLEHRGDELREKLGVELAGAILTPIDREDLVRVSRSIDAVLDNLRDFVRQCDLFGIRDPSVMVPLVETIVVAVVALREAIVAIVAAPRQISRHATMVKRAGNGIRRAYDDTIAELFRGDLRMEVLKEREAIRRLDVVGLRLGEAADALGDAAVKRGAG